MVQRRLLFAVLSMAWVSPASLLASPAAATEGTATLADLLPLLTREQSIAARMGTAYLAVAEHDRFAATEAELQSACVQGVTGLRQAVAALVRRDLARGDTVLVEGWVLARAEAETLALISLYGTRSC